MCNVSPCQEREVKLPENQILSRGRSSCPQLGLPLPLPQVLWCHLEVLPHVQTSAKLRGSKTEASRRRILTIPPSVFQETLSAPEQRWLSRRSTFPEPTQGQCELQLSSSGGCCLSLSLGAAENQELRPAAARPGSRPSCSACLCADRLLLEAVRSAGIGFCFFP